MAVQALVVHQLPGRVRLRVQERRGDAGYFSALSQDLSRLDGISHVKTNPATASVVIEYAGSADKLMQQLQFHDLSVQSPHAISSTDSAPARQMPDIPPLQLVSGRDINPMFMLGTLLAVLGIVQTVRGNILVPAMSTLWYAMSAFRQANAPQAAAESMQERPTK